MIWEFISGGAAWRAPERFLHIDLHLPRNTVARPDFPRPALNLTNLHSI
jgi:hypothetical protein